MAITVLPFHEPDQLLLNRALNLAVERRSCLLQDA